MSLYQRLYSFRGFVFTEANDVVKACKEYNLTVFSTIQRNAYNLPFVSHIMNYLVEHVNASYYGYMNSDILFHPDVFKIIPVIHDKIQRSILPNNIGLISCVRDVKYRFSVKDFSSYKSLQKVFHRGKEGKMRNPFSIVSLGNVLLYRICSFIHHLSLSLTYHLLLSVELASIVFCSKFLSMMVDLILISHHMV